MSQHKFVEMGTFSDDFVPIEIKNDERTDLFVTPFWDFELDVDNEEIVEECLNLKKKFPKGVSKSNFGGGWQSKVYDLMNIQKNVTPAVQNLAKNVVDLTNQILEDCNSEKRINDEQIGWWININKGMGYNVYHTHPGCCVIGLYYPMIPKNLKDGEGTLTLLRSDPTSHNDAFADIEDNTEYRIKPKEKHLYLMPSTIGHYVTPHFDESERISIAFNIG